MPNYQVATLSADIQVREANFQAVLARTESRLKRVSSLMQTSLAGSIDLRSDRFNAAADRVESRIKRLQGLLQKNLTLAVTLNDKDFDTSRVESRVKRLSSLLKTNLTGSVSLNDRDVAATAGRVEARLKRLQGALSLSGSVSLNDRDLGASATRVEARLKRLQSALARSLAGSVSLDDKGVAAAANRVETRLKRISSLLGSGLSGSVELRDQPLNAAASRVEARVRRLRDALSVTGTVDLRDAALNAGAGRVEGRVRGLRSLFSNLTASPKLDDRGFADAVSRIEGRVRGLRNLIAGLGLAALAKELGDGLASGLRSAVESAIDLESKFALLRKTTGVSGVALTELKDKLASLSTTMAGVKFDTLLEIATIGGRIGVSGEKLADFARDIGMITVALDDIPAEEAATSIARILNVFGKGTEDAIRFASALNKLDDSSTATGRDILDISRRLAGPASALGLSPEKVLALSTALKDVGVENEVAGTALTNVLGKLTQNTQMFANVAGVEFGRFARAVKGDPLTALSAFLRGLSRLEGSEQFHVLGELGIDGARATSTILQLTKAVDVLPRYVATAEGEWQSFGSILAENSIRGETTAAQIEILKNNLLLMSSTIGNFALPIVKSLAGSFGELAGDVKDFFVRNEAGIKKFADNFTNAGRYVGLFVKEFRTFAALAKEFGLEKFEQFVTVTERIGTQAGQNLSTGITNAFQVIRNAFDGLGTFITSFFEQLGAVSASKFSKSIATKLPDVVTNLIKRIDPELARGIKALQNEPTPTIHADTSGLSREALTRGTLPLPGFAGIFANLPNRADQIDPLTNRLARERNRLDQERANRQALANPALQQALNRPARRDFMAEVNERNRQRGIRTPFRGTRQQAQRIVQARERSDARRASVRQRTLQRSRARLGPRAAAAAAGAEQVAEGLGIRGRAQTAIGNVAATVAAPTNQRAIGAVASASGLLGGNVGRLLNVASGLNDEVGQLTRLATHLGERIGVLERSQKQRSRTQLRTPARG